MHGKGLMEDGDASMGLSTRPSMREKMIQTYPDDRCFFQSLTVVMDKTLHGGGRDHLSLLNYPIHRILEQSQEDSL